MRPSWLPGPGSSRQAALRALLVLVVAGGCGRQVDAARVADLLTSKALIMGADSTCAPGPGSWTTTDAYDSRQYGNYILNNNNWGGTIGQRLWVTSGSCWGVTTAQVTEQGNVKSYPSATRGWSQNGGLLERLSSPGTLDWTTKSGMGIRADQLVKARIHWAFTAPKTEGSRWLGLIDVYFHRSPAPTAHEFPPAVDLMIDQALMDQVLAGRLGSRSTYYAEVARRNHAATIRLGDIRYLVYVDDPGESAYHQPGGHTVHLFERPTSLSDGVGAGWGDFRATHDLKQIVDFFGQASPSDEDGMPLHFANGAEVTKPLIDRSLYLNAVNAGWEIDVGAEFRTYAFCVSLQSELDCP